ncbi:hypothetical protein BH10ACT6_BH10ACT6_02160 [soil metagenome]
MPVADSGLLAALVLAGGITAAVGIAMMLVKQHRAAQLTASRGALSVTLGLGILALAGLGIVALSPVSAQAVVTVSSTTVSPPTATHTESNDVGDVQLPTR